MKTLTKEIELKRWPDPDFPGDETIRESEILPSPGGGGDSSQSL